MKSKYYKFPTLKLKTAAADLPVTVNQVKVYLGMDEENNDFNSILTSFLSGAIKRVEDNTGRKLITQDWYQYEFDWPIENDYIELRLNPVQSITSISYRKYNDDTYTTWASSNYELDESAEPARIWLKDTATWPSDSLNLIKPIQIDFKCGYGDNVDDVDEELIMAVFQMVEHWFENRGIIVTGTIVANIPDSAKDIIKQKSIYFL